MKGFTYIAAREKVPVYTKYKPKLGASHLVNIKNEIDYEYYICDYCNQEIKILRNRQEMDGGIQKFTHLVTKQGDMQMVLHNRCLIPVLKMFENGGK